MADFKFYAVIGSWMEEDIIAACVTNAFDQGCDKVHLVDNDSPDSTVAIAMAAGAIRALSYHSDYYDEGLRTRLVNQLIDDVTIEEDQERIWWLWLDADEFPHGPAGEPLQGYLASLDTGCRVAGVRYVNHFPSPGIEYVPGCHPLGFQPLCYELRISLACRSGHPKHPLIRRDRDGPVVRFSGGAHCPLPYRAFGEASIPAVMHHFPYRGEQHTRRRLEALCGGRAAGLSRISWQDEQEKQWFGKRSGSSRRYECMDAVYAGDWAAVANLQHLEGSYGVDLVDWRALLPEVDVVQSYRGEAARVAPDRHS